MYDVLPVSWSRSEGRQGKGLVVEGLGAGKGWWWVDWGCGETGDRMGKREEDGELVVGGVPSGSWPPGCTGLWQTRSAD